MLRRMMRIEEAIRTINPTDSKSVSALENNKEILNKEFNNQFDINSSEDLKGTKSQQKINSSNEENHIEKEPAEPFLKETPQLKTNPSKDKNSLENEAIIGVILKEIASKGIVKDGTENLNLTMPSNKVISFLEMIENLSEQLQGLEEALEAQSTEGKELELADVSMLISTITTALEQMKQIQINSDPDSKLNNTVLITQDIHKTLKDINFVINKLDKNNELNIDTDGLKSAIVNTQFVLDVNSKALDKSIVDSEFKLFDEVNPDILKNDEIENNLESLGELEKAEESDNTLNSDLQGENDDSLLTQDSKQAERVTSKDGKPQELSLIDLKQKVADKMEELQKLVVAKDRLLVQINPKNLGVVDLFFKKSADGSLELTIELEHLETKQKVDALIDDLKKEFKERNMEINYLFKEPESNNKEQSQQRKNENDKQQGMNEEESFEDMIKETLGGLFK